MRIASIDQVPYDKPVYSSIAHSEHEIQFTRKQIADFIRLCKEADDLVVLQDNEEYYYLGYIQEDGFGGE